MRINHVARVALAILSICAAGCLQRRVVAKRFHSVRVAANPEHICLSPEFADIKQKILQSYSESVLLDGEPQPLYSANTQPCEALAPGIVTAGVSVRPAPPPPADAPLFFQSAPAAQAEMVRIFRENSAADARSAFSGLIASIAPENSGSPGAGSVKPRVEVTISHAVNTIGEWDRLQYISTYLILHDSDVKVVDTNQVESVMKDIDDGLLTRSTSLSADASGPIAPGASAGVRYTDSAALARQLKEQLQFRSSTIESEGRVFRITERGSVENVLPSLVRQILTLQYTPVPTRMLHPQFDANHALTGLRLVTTVRPFLKSATTADAYYEVKATPVIAAVVRRITNTSGIQTRLDDDDDVEYQPLIFTLPPITLDSVFVKYWVVAGRKAGSNGEPNLELMIKESDKEKPAAVIFASRDDAQQFARFLEQRLATLTAADKSRGAVFNGGKDQAFSDFRLGLVARPDIFDLKDESVIGFDPAVASLDHFYVRLR